jgi:GDP-L-fucose synthase
MEKGSKIYVADNDGLIGAAILAELNRASYANVLPRGQAPVLTDPTAVDEYFAHIRPTHVFLVGGKTAGIKGNQLYPAMLMRDNLLVNCHVIDNAHRHGVQKILYLASSCVYPKFAEQPMKVEYISSGKLEPTNEPYAIAKLAGLFLSQAYRQQFGCRFITAIPANVFGPRDNFNLEDSHVVAALMRRMHEAKIRGVPSIEIWGSGLPRREFIFSRDLARACLFLMDVYEGQEPINIGVGRDWSIRELAEMIREVVGYTGKLTFDCSKPDGMPAKLLDSSRIGELGWQPHTSIRDALSATYEWFLQHGHTGHEGDEDVRAVL